ncbi:MULTISPECIES: hypothetical protein [unclassified Variovorax]|jgi:hypothetical protein|uniref:hypothetical protein n=1 Tax=unclassified Variovorax TaxID=663243 RepID=UPI0008C546AE|nr:MULTISPECIES: hypothetical protein [unclassified Variovorax]SEK16637.1 hypothetical protein SAMN05518853_12839 [Variovorax sp. OK202]SFD11276.1 hypothetical protein SAMN05444746_104509 [Variovorax sp. OK212]
MSKKGPFKDLIIRTAVVLSPRYGIIYACDPALERRGEPHACVFVWDDGSIDRGDCNYDAHSACLIDLPEEGSVDISEAGYYTADTENDRVTQDLFDSYTPAAREKRARGLRSVREIGGVAHAIGIRGMVYRLDALDRWTRIDEGLPHDFDGQAIHGTGLSDLHAVGFRGDAWHFDGKVWRRQDLPTNRNLTSVVCAADGTVYVAGHDGILLRGRPGQWESIEHGDTDENIWDLEWFAGQLFVSTLDGLFSLQGDHLKPVAYGKHTPKSTYQLSTKEGVMWSNGESDIMEFDGKTWTRIV